MRRVKTAIAAGVLALVAVAIASSAVTATRMHNAIGPGMMGPGMMGGAFGGVGAGGAGPSGDVKPSGAQLTAVRDRVNAWLGQSGFKGFEVAEVMAFTNNDYVAVHDRAGKPAFELLTNLATNWVMEEPPSMMWNTRYGMMGGLGSRVGPMMGGWMTSGHWYGWYGSGGGKVTSTDKAVEVANQWLASASPGEQVASDAGGTAMGKFPGYYSFDTMRSGKTAGMVSVNATTGAIWYHAWHGAFLAEKAF